MRIFVVTLIVLVATAPVMVACGDDSPEVTIEQRLERIAGEDLTPAEVERRMEVASTLCATDSDVLEHMWTSMSIRQLRFQDFVFGTHCPQRSVEYAVVTGRSLTPEAKSALTDGADEPTTPSTLSLPTTSSTTP